MSEHRSSEWPLVIFTVGLQLCCGIVIATTALDATGAGTTGLVRTLGLSVFPLALAVMFGSTFHLGRPFAGWRALVNMGKSRLSLEVALTGLFAASTFFYSLLWLGNRADLRLAVGIATTVLGASAVIASSRIYTIPTQPFWNSGWVTISFVGATLVASGTTFALCVGGSAAAILPKIFAVITALGAALVLASAMLMLRRLKVLARERYANPCAPPLVKPSDWASLAAFVLLAGLLPLFAASSLWSAAGAVVSGALLVVVTVLGLLGVMLGRVFMYALGTSLSRF